MGANISKTELNDNDLEILSEINNKPKEEILEWYQEFLRDCPGGKLNRKQFVEYYKKFRKNENVEEVAKVRITLSSHYDLYKS